MEKETKPVVKKPAKKKKPVVKKVELLSYAIKMVIPTVAYGNIQPEIIVRANSIDEAHDFVVPHMNKLWKEYYLVDGRRPEPVITPPPVQVTPPINSQPPTSSVAFVKANQAINSCMSLEALDLIINQVLASVKLTDEDKQNLGLVIDAKQKELNEKR